MKTFIASDFHGKSPADLVRRLQNEEIERAVFLGDYDEPSVLREIQDLDIGKIILMGNHDYDFSRGSEVYSPKLTRPLEEYFKIWGNTDGGRFARNCPTKVVQGDIVYLHGSLYDPYGYGDAEVWGRILYDDLGFTRERRVICNFREMKKSGYNMMFRGHDHYPIVFSTNRENYSEKIDEIVSSIDNVILNKGDMHIINLGAFVEGEYAVFDDENLEFEFRNIRDA
jgi:predicted phosphodiesterase